MEEATSNEPATYRTRQIGSRAISCRNRARLIRLTRCPQLRLRRTSHVNRRNYSLASRFPSIVDAPVCRVSSDKTDRLNVNNVIIRPIDRLSTVPEDKLQVSALCLNFFDMNKVTVCSCWFQQCNWYNNVTTN